VICDGWDVITVPFPFTDRAAQKRRPALVSSRRVFNRHGHTIMAMITSSRLPNDVALARPEACGLSRPCAVRLKIFTLDNRLIPRRIGALAEEDRSRVANEIGTVLAV
jgi:mRNA interferase MazF